MDLQSLILPSKTVEFEYEGVEGLHFSLAFLSKSCLEDMRKENTKNVKNKYTKAYEEELDQEAFLRQYIPAVLKGWRGLNLDTIQHFIIVGEQEDTSKEVAYSEDNAYLILTNSTDLDTWVSEKIGDIENFRNSK
jgi:hypothetical protein